MSNSDSETGGVVEAKGKGPDSGELRCSVSCSTQPKEERRKRSTWRNLEKDLFCEGDEEDVYDSDLDPEYVLDDKQKFESDDESPEKVMGKGKKRMKIFPGKEVVAETRNVGGPSTSGLSRKSLQPDDINTILFRDSDSDYGDAYEITKEKRGEEEVKGSVGEPSGGGEGEGSGGGEGEGSALMPLPEIQCERDDHNSDGDVSDNGFSDDNVGRPTVARQKRQIRKQGRKSEVHESDWEVNVAKRKRNEGKEYISYKTKKVMPPRKVGPACRDACFTKVGMDNINEIHKAFWAIGEYNKQNEYMMRCITQLPFKRKYTKKEISKRQAKLLYTVSHDDNDYEVCREGFLNIFGLKRGRLEVIMKKIRESKHAAGVMPEDKRGKTVPKNKISGATLDTLHEYIATLPVVSSHYTRAKAPLRQYLPSGGSVNGVFAEYQVWMRVNHTDVPAVSSKYFRKVFTKQYNIEFAPPKKDLCNFCSEIDIKIEQLQNATSESDVSTRTELEGKKKAHLEDAATTRVMMKHELNTHPLDEEFRAIAIDLQQQQLCPKMPVNRAYYTSKLWFRNFCIFDITGKKAYMFPWDETAGSRGPNEIVSCILRWLKHVRETEGKRVSKLRIFADNCAGQNKNIYVVLFFLQQIQLTLLRRVDIVFLVSGHSYMHCDRAFGVVEKMYQKEAYITSIPQYIDLLKRSCKKNAFVVLEMNRNDFFNIKQLENCVTNRSKGVLAKAKQFVIKESCKTGFFIKNNYEVADFHMVHIDLRKGRQSAKSSGRGRPPQDPSMFLAHFPLQNKYPQERRMKKKKIKSLRSLICMIPDPVAMEWFNNLLNRQDSLHVVGNTGSDADESDNEDYSEDEENPGNRLLTDAAVLLGNPDASSPSGEEDSA